MADPSPTVQRRLGSLSTASISDALLELGHSGQVVASTILPLHPMELCAPAFAIKGKIDEGRDQREVLLDWTALLSSVPEGHVVVCEPNDERVAHFGELSALALSVRGAAGYIVDGGCRDTELVAETGLPVWARYRTPVAGRWWAEPADSIEMGGVRIASGDFIRADSDGIVVIPEHVADSVASAGETVRDAEATVRERLREGGEAHALMREFGVF